VNKPETKEELKDNKRENKPPEKKVVTGREREPIRDNPLFNPSARKINK